MTPEQKAYDCHRMGLNRPAEAEENEGAPPADGHRDAPPSDTRSRWPVDPEIVERFVGIDRGFRKVGCMRRFAARKQLFIKDGNIIHQVHFCTALLVLNCTQGCAGAAMRQYIRRC
jgi:hypothetical protein